MGRALATLMATALFAGVWMVSTTDVATATEAPVLCAGLSVVPADAMLAADRHGDAILITSSGLVIRCDGSGVVTLSQMGLGVDTHTTVTSLPESSFVAPIGSQQSWSITQETFIAGSNDMLVGFLGSNVDMTVIFWRSTVGGPIETWIFQGATITP